MRNDVLEGQKIIEKFRAKKRKDRRRFYFWYSDALQRVLPVEIIKIDNDPNNRYNVMVCYQPNGYDTWDNRFVRACDLFNSRKELVDEMIKRKEEEMEEFRLKVQTDCWVPQYDENLKRDLTSLEIWNKMKDELCILQNLR